jgi:hypothetical protein
VFGLGSASYFGPKNEVKSGCIMGRCRTCQKGNERVGSFVDLEVRPAQTKHLHKKTPCSKQKVC